MELDREGLLDELGSEDFVGGAKAQLGAVEEEGLVEEGGGGIEIVVGGDDEAAFFGEIGEEGGQGLGRIAVEAGEGFVEKKDVCFLGEGARKEGALLLAPGEFADLAVVEVGDGEGLEGAVDRLVVGGTVALPKTEVRVAAHLHQSANGDGKGPVDFFALGKVGKFAGPLVDRSTSPLNGAGAARDEPGDGFEKGGLAGSVGTDESDAIAAGGSKGNVLECRDRSVGHAEALNHQFVMVIMMRAAVVGVGRGNQRWEGGKGSRPTDQ
jgi:hypothetical protein